MSTIVGARPSDFTLRTPRLQADLREPRRPIVMRGAGVDTAEIAARYEAHEPGLGDTVLGILGGVADLVPRADDPLTCDRISVGLALETEPVASVD